MFVFSKLFANFSWVMLANLITGGVNFFAMAWFALKLGPASMGEYAIIVTTLQIISSFLSPGFDQALIRNPDCRDTTTAAGYATIAQSLILMTVVGIAYILFHFQAPAAAGNLLYPGAIMLISMMLSFFSNLFAAPIAATQNYRYLSYARLFSSLLGIGMGIVLVMKGAGIYGIVSREFITVLVVLIFYKIKSPLQLLAGGVRRPGLMKLMRFASGMWVLNTLERVVFRLDYVLVGSIFGKELLGMYFVLRGLVEGMLGFLISPIQTVLYTHYCRLHDRSLLRWPLTSRLSAGYWIGVLALAILGYYLSPWIVMMLGQAYQTVYVIVPSLVLYAGSTLWYENVKVWFMAQQLHHKLITARVVQLLFILVAIYPMAKLFEILGAGLATAMGALSLAVTSWIFVARRLSLKTNSGWLK